MRPTRDIHWWGRLAQHRQDAGYTQAQVHERLGISVKTLSRIENGSVAVKLPTLLALLELYDVPIEAAFVGDEPWDIAFAQLLRSCYRLTPGQLGGLTKVAELIGADAASMV